MNYKKIKTWEDAAKALNIDPIKSLPYQDAENADQESINGFFKMQNICKLLNDGWAPNWDNWNELKYYPWFRLSGSGFSYGDYVGGYDGTGVGARLVFKSRELAEYAGKQFTDIYKSFMAL